MFWLSQLAFLIFACAKFNVHAVECTDSFTTIQNCITCTEFTCTECATGFWEFVCSAEFFGSSSCIACTLSECATCQKQTVMANSNGVCAQPAAICTSCNENFFLSAGTCNLCSEGCATCTSGTVCTKCNFGFRKVTSGSVVSCTADLCLETSSTSTGLDCDGHGTCSSNGICVCHPGWFGTYCQGVDLCYNTGDDLECSGHGTCDNFAGCTCTEGWTGTACASVCNPGTGGLACSGHGTCIQNSPCTCNEGWTGSTCNECEPGFSGLNCQINECPNCDHFAVSSAYSQYEGSCNCEQPNPRAGFCHSSPQFTNNGFTCSTAGFFVAPTTNPCNTTCSAIQDWIFKGSTIPGVEASNEYEFLGVSACTTPAAYASVGACVALVVGHTATRGWLLCSTRGCTGQLCNVCAGSAAYCTVTQSTSQRLFYWTNGDVPHGFYQSPVYDPVSTALMGYCRSAPLTETQLQLANFFESGNNIGTMNCASGYGGPACTNACPNDFCSSGGVCVLVGSTWTCQILCPTDSNAITCHGKGTCITSTGICDCFPPWNGVACTQQCPVDLNNVVCHGVGTCVAQGNAWICTQCGSIWGGPACNVTCPNSCSGHGNCIGAFAGNSLPVCECFNPYGGPSCSAQCPTTNNGICSGVGTCNFPDCTCDDGYVGAACNITCPLGSSFDAAPCSALANTCHTIDGVPTCVCPDGYVGDGCQITCPIVDGFMCAEFVGTCHTINGKPTCVCIDGRGGPACTTFCGDFCSTPNVCVTLNGNTSFCECASGFVGPTCLECPHEFYGPYGSSESICGNGRCVYNSIGPAAECICNPGAFGPMCQFECDSTGCGHGNCTYSPDTGAFCQCDYGWITLGPAFGTASPCDIQCPLDIHGVVCGGGGTCLPVYASETGVCQCNSGRVGPACSAPCPVDLFGRTCSNQGLCDLAFNPGLCLCLGQWDGPACNETCPTSSSGLVCNNQGTCLNSTGIDVMRQCDCFTGWFGPSCSESCNIACLSEQFVSTENNGTCNCANIQPLLCNCEVLWVPAIPSYTFTPGCPWGLYQYTFVFNEASTQSQTAQVCCDQINPNECNSTNPYGAPHSVNCVLGTIPVPGWQMCPPPLFSNYAIGFTNTSGQAAVFPSTTQIQDFCFDNIECNGYTINNDNSVSFFRRRPDFTSNAGTDVTPGNDNYMPYSLPPAEVPIHAVEFTPGTSTVYILDRSYGYGSACPYPLFTWTFYRDNGGIGAQLLLAPFLSPAITAQPWVTGHAQLSVLATIQIPGLVADIPVWNSRIPLYAPAYNQPTDTVTFTCSANSGYTVLYVAYNPGSICFEPCFSTLAGMSNVLVGWMTVPLGTDAIRFVQIAQIVASDTTPTDPEALCLAVEFDEDPTTQQFTDVLGMLGYMTYIHWGGSYSEAEASGTLDATSLLSVGFGIKSRLNSDPNCLYTLNRLYSAVPENQCGVLDGRCPFPDNPIFGVTTINTNYNDNQNYKNARLGSRPCNGRGLCNAATLPAQCQCDIDFTVYPKMNEFSNDTQVGTRGAEDLGCGFSTAPCADPADNITQICFLNQGACVLQYESYNDGTLQNPARFSGCSCGGFPFDINGIQCNLAQPRDCESQGPHGSPVGPALQWVFNGWETGQAGTSDALTCRVPFEGCRRDAYVQRTFNRPTDLSWSAQEDSYGCELPPDNMETSGLPFEFGNCLQTDPTNPNSFSCISNCGNIRWGPYCEMVPVAGKCTTAAATGSSLCRLNTGISPEGYWFDNNNRAKYEECGDNITSDCTIPCVGQICSGNGICTSNITYVYPESVRPDFADAPDEISQFCQCNPFYSGAQCQNQVCQPACVSPNGVCDIPTNGNSPICVCGADIFGRVVWTGADCSIPNFNSGGLLNIINVTYTPNANPALQGTWSATCAPGWLSINHQTLGWCTLENCVPDPTCGGFSVSSSNPSKPVGCYFGPNGNTNGVCSCSDVPVTPPPGVGGTAQPQLESLNGTCIDRCNYYKLHRGYWNGAKCVCNSTVSATGPSCLQTSCGIYGRVVTSGNPVQITCDCFLDTNRDPATFCSTCLVDLYYEPAGNTSAKCQPCNCGGNQMYCASVPAIGYSGIPGLCVCQSNWVNPAGYNNQFVNPLPKLPSAGCTECAVGYYGPTCIKCPATCPNGGTCQTGVTGTGCPGTSQTSSSSGGGGGGGGGSSSGGSSSTGAVHTTSSSSSSSSAGATHTTSSSSTGITHASSSSGVGSTSSSTGKSSGSSSSSTGVPTSTSSSSSTFWTPLNTGLIVMGIILFLIGLTFLVLWQTGVFPKKTPSGPAYSPVSTTATGIEMTSWKGVNLL